MPLSSGTRLGAYEITAPIGEGGMGQVFRARDTRLNRDVAIKILPEAFAQDADRLERFDREAKTLASLNHPHIAGIYGLEEREGVVALVMELVEGDDLSQRIARGAMPIDEALPIAKQIAAALEAAHEQGIVHRDLKPANIKVRADGTVKVLDFGLAKSIEPPASSSAGRSMSPTITSPALGGMTQAGMILGTAAYMSPEQAKGRAVDKRTDIWAFGAVLYEMLTGARAFKGDDVTDTMARILMQEPDWAAVPATVPAAIVTVMQCCLQKDRTQRLRDIGDVALALGGAFDTGGTHAMSSSGATPLAVRRHIREYLAWGLAAVATVAAIVPVLYQRAPRQAQTVVRFTQASPYRIQRSWGFAVAPDGQSLAFGARAADGVSRVFVRRFDSTEARVVGGTDRVAQNVFWAPDGRSLGFVKDDGLYRVDLDGGSVRRLCDVRQVFGATWGTQGTIVFASSNSGLLSVRDTGGTPSPVTTLDPNEKEVLHASPRFLPDGRHLIFLALGRGTVRGVVWAVATDSPGRTRLVESSGGAAYADGKLLFSEGTPRRLVAQPFDVGRLALQGTSQTISDRINGGSTGGDPGFAVSGGVLVVDRVSPSVHQLTWIDRHGQPLGTVGPAADLYDFALAPDGQRVAAVIRDPDSRKNEIWLFDPQKDAGARLFVQGNRLMWAHDGRKIYFTNSADLSDLRAFSIGASEATSVANPGRLIHFDDVTPDGRYFVLKSPAVMGSAVWIQRTDDPTDRRALVQGQGQFTAAQGRVSPDGRWLAFLLERAQSREVFVQPFDRPGERIQISTKGGLGPIWRDDGRELYYEADDALMAVSIDERGGALAAGTPQKLFSIHTQGYVPNIPHNVEVAARGQKFLVNTIVGDSDNVPLEVTFNWTTGLQK